ISARCCGVSCSSVLVVAVELVPVMGPGCWATAGPALADTASTKTAIRRGYPITSSFQESWWGNGRAQGLVSRPQSFARVSDFSTIGANGPQYLCANLAPGADQPNPMHAHADDALPSPHAHAGSAPARRRPGSGRVAGARVRHRHHQLRSGAASELRALRSRAIADGRHGLRALPQYHPGALSGGCCPPELRPPPGCSRGLTVTPGNDSSGKRARPLTAVRPRGTVRTARGLGHAGPD